MSKDMPLIFFSAIVVGFIVIISSLDKSQRNKKLAESKEKEKNDLSKIPDDKTDIVITNQKQI